MKGHNTFNRSSSGRNWAPNRRNARIPHKSLAPLRCNETASRGKETSFVWWKDFYNMGREYREEEKITIAERKRWAKKYWNSIKLAKQEIPPPPPPFVVDFVMGKERFGEARDWRVCILERESECGCVWKRESFGGGIWKRGELWTCGSFITTGNRSVASQLCARDMHVDRETKSHSPSLHGAHLDVWMMGNEGTDMEFYFYFFDVALFFFF